MGVTTAVSDWIIDVDEGTFQSAVIERSRELPVVVDFWAVWCGPCRTLGPMLEKLAQEYAGRFILARLNVDENQHLSAQYNIQGIPAVKGFRDGKVAEEFVGAVPQPAVRQFLERLLPNELDLQVTVARKLLAAGQAADAEAALSAALQEQPDYPPALLALAELEISREQYAAALAWLDRVPAGTKEGAEASRLRQGLRVRQAAAGATESELNDKLAADPADLASRFQLASLLAAERRYQEALEQYLEVVRRDRGTYRNQAREAMVYLFDTLGEDPLARTYRNRLASLLFA